MYYNVIVNDIDIDFQYFYRQIYKVVVKYTIKGKKNLL